jgi:hypothetical protein
VTDQRKALARCAAKDDVHSAVLYPGVVADVLSVDVGHAAADRCAVGKVEFMRRAMNWVVFDAGGDIEACLLESEAHPSRAREQVNADWSSGSAPHETNAS